MKNRLKEQNGLQLELAYTFLGQVAGNAPEERLASKGHPLDGVPIDCKKNIGPLGSTHSSFE